MLQSRASVVCPLRNWLRSAVWRAAAVAADKELLAAAVWGWLSCWVSPAAAPLREKPPQDTWEWWHVSGEEGYQEFRMKEVWSLKIHLHVWYCQASEKRETIACMCLASCEPVHIYKLKRWQSRFKCFTEIPFQNTVNESWWTGGICDILSCWQI